MNQLQVLQQKQRSKSGVDTIERTLPDVGLVKFEIKSIKAKELFQYTNQFPSIHQAILGSNIIETLKEPEGIEKAQKMVEHFDMLKALVVLGVTMILQSDEGEARIKFVYEAESPNDLTPDVLGETLIAELGYRVVGRFQK